MPDGRLRAPLAPGSTIGILGSGQLGRMLAMAAARLGLKTHVYCEDSGPAFDVATHTTKAGFADRTALSAFAKVVNAVTYEFENVPLATAGHLAALVPVRPGTKALEVAQDRLTEKTFLTSLGIPVAPFRAVANEEEARTALAELGAAAILKTRRFGYDGKGQISLAPGDDAAAAWAAINARPAVLEQRLDFAAELSALIVRAQDGALAVYDCPINVHQNGILHRSSVPAGLPADDLARARQIGAAIADALDYIGVLAVEMFYLGPETAAAERLLVNEIAPRVHNSGHWTIDACGVSQFENHVRAVAGWPLGSTARHSAAEMTNLIGAAALDWHQLAREPGLCLHLYGKREARQGRKMGHVTRLVGGASAPKEKGNAANRSR
jgi:5-(carboxyamino)imidazole ribonucleotide synthase